jgi:catechol 2,3-dioxygenase-like lactoylglutathione lyase family enzyme
MQPLGILETCLYTSDLEAAIGFYTAVIGLTCIAHQPGRHAFFRCGPAMLLLFDPAGTLPGHGATGPGHVAFNIGPEEFDAWRVRLAVHGVKITSEHSWKPGALSIYFRDPAGNSLELTTPATWA